MPRRRDRRLRSAVLARLWLLGVWVAARRRVRARTEDVQGQVYRQQTRGMGVRMSEWLRDRMRPTWLRVQRDEDDSEKC